MNVAIYTLFAKTFAKKNNFYSFSVIKVLIFVIAEIYPLSDSDRIRLVVSNNKDSGEGSLRQALYQAQRQNYYGKDAKFDIVFESKKAGNSNLSTGYFTIGLKSPLKVERMDIRINHINPRAVILAPARSLGGVDAKSTSLLSDTRKPSGALLSVGSTNVVNGDFHKNAGKMMQRPKLSINNVHFIRNIARGSDGEPNRGGGGGLGTGGGILVFNGDLEVQNSVFQDLVAQGGSGARGTRGGHGGKGRANWAESGEAGGKGGLPSWHPPQHSHYGVNGGAGGLHGISEDLPGCSIDSPQNLEYIRGFVGGNGEDLPNDDFFIGRGGSGGGANGGAGWWIYKKRNFIGACSTQEVRFVRANLKSSRPGKEGLYGGRGKPGGWGGDFGNRGSVSSVNAGTSGEALGSAIAVWSGPLGPIWNRKQASNIVLKNVNFFGNNLTRFNNPDNSWTRPDSLPLFAAPRKTNSDRKKNPEPRLLLEDVRHGISRDESQLLTVGEIPHFTKLNKSDNPFSHGENSSPTHLGLSEPRVIDVADVNDVYLQASNDLSDIFVIGFEARSTRIGITQDLTDPANPLNKIWRELVPDEESKIYQEYSELMADYYSQYNQSYWDAVLKGNLEEFGANLAKEAFVDICEAATEKKTGGFGCESSAELIHQLTVDTIAYNNSKAEIEQNIFNANEQLHTDLKENQQKQDELNRYLEAASEATFANFDLSLQRSRVIIEDFELGHDSVTFPAHKDASGRISPVQFEVPVAAGSQEIAAIRYSTEDTIFAELHLSSDSVAVLNQSTMGLEATLRGMLTLSEDENMWILGDRQPELIVLDSSRSFTSGPAGVDLLVDRNRRSVSYDLPVEIDTQVGQDVVIGSSGYEIINTGEGDDIILPGGIFSGVTPDSVNGANGNDLVSYVGLLEPVKIDFNRDKYVVYSLEDELNRLGFRKRDSVIGYLRNVENFHVFGDSVIDFKSVDLSQDSDSDGSQRLSVISGAGSHFYGGDHDDHFEISFYDDYNQKGSRLGRTAVFEGNAGVDVFKLAAEPSEYLFKVERVSAGMHNIYAKEIASGTESLVVELESIESMYINDNPIIDQHIDGEFVQFT